MAEQLIHNARPRFGFFDDAVEVNLEDYQHITVRGKKAGPWASWVGYKRFQYFGILSNGVLAGCAIAHLRHTAVAFVYVYTPKDGMLFEKTYRAPLGIGCNLSDSPLNGVSQFNFGRVKIALGYENGPRAKSLSVDVPGKLKIDASFDETAANFDPMSLCTRIGRNGWVYAHKVAAVQAAGHIECAGQQFDLPAHNAYAHHDFSAGYMRRETFWNWACFSGQDAQDKPVGLNVSCGVNETSYSENCYWHEGKLYPLGLCQFEYNWNAPADHPWKVTNQDRRLQMDFKPEGLHSEKLNLGLVGGDFKQIFGRFNGRIRHTDGSEIIIQNMPGFVEDQYAKW